MCAALLQAVPAQASAPGKPPAPPKATSVPVTAVVSKYAKPKPMPSYRPSAAVWPSGSAEVALDADSLGIAQRAGSLPVWIGAPDKPDAPKPAAGKSSSGKHAAARLTAPPTVAVKVLPRASAQAAGVNGVLLSLTAEGRASQTRADVGATLDYSRFADAFGGDWASRLHLVTLPACALTTPDKAGCRTQRPVASQGDAAAKTLTASDIPLEAASSTTVVAAVSSAGGGGGNFAATSLQPSSTWQAGGSSDAFSWSYPIVTPTVPGGLAPKVELDYNSQSQDGLTSSTNNQASPIGDGFGYDPGFIERSYQSCDQNPAGATKTQDNCWSDDDTLTLSLAGKSSTLIKDDATGTWRPQDDANERVQYETGASNGAHNGEYWVVTGDDGTQYYFGLDQLPGYASGDATTNSVWTEPVYATASGQPCYNATFANSWCQQAYRWNLDYVVDSHQDALSYWYTDDTGYYARDLGTTANTPYTRSGYLSRIDYGQRAGQVYSTTPAGRVSFTVSGRCDTSGSGCATSTLSSSTAKDWPDVPYDLQCAQNAACTVNTPTFWSTYELTGIQTQALDGSTLSDVDKYAFTHTFPPTGDSTTPSLWLSTIVRTGEDAQGTGPTTSIPLPPVTLAGRPLANRVDVTDGYPPITRHRLDTITTETGEVISVDYSSAACGSATPSDPSQNTKLCYPAYWTPGGQTEPIQDWFNKYVVTSVTEQDKTGGGVNDDITTHYTPIGTPAWHYDDSVLTPSKQRTWNDFRGFQGMKVTTGVAPDPITETDYTYFRGMDGDTLPNNGTRSATVTDSRGDPAVTDLDQYAGLPYEAIRYDGTGSGKVVTDTITDPWTSASRATHTLTGGLPAQHAYLTGESRERVYTPFSDGRTGETETDFTHDSYGRVTKTDDLGDVSTAADDQCATVTYADNTTAWILDAPDENTTVAVDCSTTPSFPRDAVSDTRTYYDGSTTFGAAPTSGTATMTQKASSYSGSTPVFTTTSSSTVDEYGRTLTDTDADNRTTTTHYTPATGASPTSVSVTDPKSLATVTTYDPLRDLPLTSTDPASYVTKHQYDALGRSTADFKPGITSAVDKHTYTISASAPSLVTTQTLNNDANDTYRTSEVLYDSLLRQRETQTATEDGGRNVTDTVYNTDGWQASTTDPYHNGSAVSTTLVQAQASDIPSATGYLYDGAGRQTAAISYKLGTETWRTTTSYGGNVTTTVPPKGGVAQSTFIDARGNTTAVYQYHSGVPADPVNDPAADYSATRYTYDASGNRTGETDAAGNTWSWTFDLLGNQVSAADPDAGTTTSTYDAAGQLLTTTDALGHQATYAYDADGRKTFSYDTTGGAAPSAANETGAWTYDTVKKGLPTATTSYQKGTSSPSVTNTVLNYNGLGLPGSQRETLANLPAADAALEPSGGYVTSRTYTAVSGLLASRSYAAAGGIAGEQVLYDYDLYGQPISAGSDSTTIGWDYVSAVGYDEFGKPLQYTMGTSGNWAALALTYDQQTQRLTNAQTTTATSSTVVDNTSYSYQDAAVSGGAGLVTSTTDKQNSGAVTDQQCFDYDYATRLDAAWTATDGCAATPAPGDSASVGGPQPYWQSWTYDAAGNRATQTDHDTSGEVAGDTTTTYTYPAQGSADDQPHTLNGTTASGPDATAHTASYTYDKDGDEKSVTTQAGTQTMDWNDQGKLASLSDTATGGTTTYLYDTDGNLVLRTDPGQTTLFLDGQQVVEDNATHALTATRYYDLDGTTIAERSSSGDVQYLIPDRQGTDTLAIDYQTLAATRRSYLPFGGERTAPSVWPGGDDGYVGGTPDAATGLENLGAREYDPSSGRFLSVDPVFEADDPTQMGGYDYAGNDPVTGSDPTGTMLYDDVTGLGFGNVQGMHDWYHDQGYTDSNGHATAKLNRLLYQQAVSYYTYQYELAHPLPKPKAKKKKSRWGSFTSDIAKGAKIAYHASGASDVVGCVSDPSLGGCAKAGALVAGFVFTGGEDELEIAAYEAGEEMAEKEAADLGEDAAACVVRPHSFTGDTPVLEANGTSEPIADVEVGQQVLATDPQTGQTAARTVEKVIRTTTDHDFTQLTITPAAGPQPDRTKSGPVAAPKPATLTTTWHHPFWNATTHQWVDASHLTPGTHLREPNGTDATVTAVRNYHTTAVTYDLTVAGLHSYYVLAGGTPVLVHNCGTGPSDELLDLADANIGRTNVASEVTSTNGAKGYGVSSARNPSTLTPKVREAVEETGHHGGCAEVGALCDLEKQGAPLVGAKPAAVKIAGGSQGYDYAEHGEELLPCPACQRMFTYLNTQG
ncbi:intein C-terminal splicing region/RHS repeat-associated core domain-containing protein [Actinacidiphila guanduensis]|uniref:Intein C-terminal splicing region/RHS repeat-associated core domain-containing protein n=1 Tax=Actinacidiphila guanduensis TaxID=310781 RepID=A0A1H0NAZ7_9ACTN|nr:intein C-terminal splicing region/RHS repeat-associated core domain-containing protein [Actinacidiphila guanduensis]